jgi:hypothetical protein
MRDGYAANLQQLTYYTITANLTRGHAWVGWRFVLIAGCRRETFLLTAGAKRGSNGQQTNVGLATRVRWQEIVLNEELKKVQCPAQ